MLSKKRWDLPLTPSDLREVAKLIEKTERLLYTKNGEYKADFFSTATTGIWTIPVVRPDAYYGGDDVEIIGHLVPEDGWLGFVPLGEIETNE